MNTAAKTTHFVIEVTNFDSGNSWKTSMNFQLRIGENISYIQCQIDTHNPPLLRLSQAYTTSVDSVAHVIVVMRVIHWIQYPINSYVIKWGFFMECRNQRQSVCEREKGVSITFCYHNGLTISKEAQYPDSFSLIRRSNTFVHYILFVGFVQWNCSYYSDNTIALHFM